MHFCESESDVWSKTVFQELQKLGLFMWDTEFLKKGVARCIFTKSIYGLRGSLLWGNKLLLNSFCSVVSSENRSQIKHILCIGLFSVSLNIFYTFKYLNYTEMFLIQPQHMGKEFIKTSNLLIPQKCQGLPFTSLRP